MYKQWFYNNGARKQRVRKHLIKYGRKWTAREVKTIIQEQTGMKLGEKGMMKHYQRVVTKIMQGLTSDELKEAEATTLAWSQEGPPADIQTNIAKTKGESLIKYFATEMYRQAGMRIFVVSAWKEQDRKLMIGGHDFNDKIGGGERFMDTKDWQVILEEWNPYAEEQFNMQEGTDDRVIRGKTQAGLDLQTTKDLIRDFMTIHYRHCCQKVKVPVPWATIISQQEEFIKSKYLPEATRIKDPSKLKKAEAQMLLQFWHQRQKHTTDTTFEFKGWVDSDGNIHSPVRKPTQRSNDRARSHQPLQWSRTRKSRARSTGNQNTDEESSEDNDDARLPPRQKSKCLARQRATTGSCCNSPIGPIIDIDSQSSQNAGWKGNGHMKARVASISCRKEPESDDSIQPRPLVKRGIRTRLPQTDESDVTYPPISISPTAMMVIGQAEKIQHIRGGKRPRTGAESTPDINASSSSPHNQCLPKNLGDAKGGATRNLVMPLQKPRPWPGLAGWLKQVNQKHIFQNALTIGPITAKQNSMPPHNNIVPQPHILVPKPPPRLGHPEKSKSLTSTSAMVAIHEGSPTGALVTPVPNNLPVERSRPRPRPAGKLLGTSSHRPTATGKHVLLDHFVDKQHSQAPVADTVRMIHGQNGTLDETPSMLPLRDRKTSEKTSGTTLTPAEVHTFRAANNTCQNANTAVSSNCQHIDDRSGGTGADLMLRPEQGKGVKRRRVDELPEPPRKQAVRQRRLPSRPGTLVPAGAPGKDEDQPSDEGLIVIAIPGGADAREEVVVTIWSVLAAGSDILAVGEGGMGWVSIGTVEDLSGLRMGSPSTAVDSSSAEFGV
ncbi:uncharacterized protein F5891DRAFT_980629 [Suillus fuscotomentosus]|uniref:Uncharacterized protein n=1 Tax=Suillus fuscotomentosus TaxID=1912939 RepID=A0AAD4HKJ6_9AGAM|nr:uncharacterized protein F5891DRAFT_980629 [Suillus fuscotomentosus]KAG1900013.1 hypothetical protein F5891DRAFT_980629 [Suillus fuscotomentosus]